MKKRTTPFLQSFLFCEKVDQSGDELTLQGILDYVHIRREPAPFNLTWYSSWAGVGVVGSFRAVYRLIGPDNKQVFARQVPLDFDEGIDIRRYADTRACRLRCGNYSMELYLDGQHVGSFPLRVLLP